MAKNKTKTDLPKIKVEPFPPEAVAALKQIANSLAYLIINSEQLKKKSNVDRIILLDSIGFDKNSIASLVDTSLNYVSAQLSKAKSSKNTKKAKSTK